jgi:hypothetical protein
MLKTNQQSKPWFQNDANFPMLSLTATQKTGTTHLAIIRINHKSNVIENETGSLFNGDI